MENPKEEPKCTCKENDPYCCQVHGTCPTCVKKEELKTNLERLPFLELIKEFAEYYKKVPLVEEPKQECTCENPTDNTCGYCEKENKFEILEEAKKRAKNYMSLKGALEPKQETLELPVEINFANEIEQISEYDKGRWYGRIEGAKWQAERMYSEEEVINLLNEFSRHLIFNKSSDLTINQWFKQFKKK